ncbi:hypothetical protein ACOME3_002336 [Neoechinorhynchus agilis]
MVLLTVLRKRLHKSKVIRIVMLGLDNAGKTTILHKMFNEDVDSIAPSFNLDIRTKTLGDIIMNIWDVGGQASIRQYWDTYFERTHVVIFVVDCASPDRILECRRVLGNLLAEPRLNNALFLIFGNKHDIPGAMNEDEIREKLDIIGDLINTHRIIYKECSGITGYGVEDGINELLNELSKILRWNRKDAL